MNCGVIATCPSGIAVGIRSEPAPTGIVRPQRSPAAISSETLDARNSRSAISAILRSVCSAWPGDALMSRITSALAAWRSRAARSSLFSLAFWDLELLALEQLGLGLIDLGLIDFVLPDLDWGTGFLRLVAVARFFAFRPPS